MFSPVLNQGGRLTLGGGSIFAKPQRYLIACQDAQIEGHAAMSVFFKTHPIEDHIQPDQELA